MRIRSVAMIFVALLLLSVVSAADADSTYTFPVLNKIGQPVMIQKDGSLVPLTITVKDAPDEQSALKEASKNAAQFGSENHLGPAAYSGQQISAPTDTYTVSDTSYGKVVWYKGSVVSIPAGETADSYAQKKNDELNTVVISKSEAYILNGNQYISINNKDVELIWNDEKKAYEANGKLYTFTEDQVQGQPAGKTGTKLLFTGSDISADKPTGQKIVGAVKTDQNVYLKIDGNLNYQFAAGTGPPVGGGWVALTPAQKETVLKLQGSAQYQMNGDTLLATTSKTSGKDVTDTTVSVNEAGKSIAIDLYHDGDYVGEVYSDYEYKEVDGKPIFVGVNSHVHGVYDSNGKEIDGEVFFSEDWKMQLDKDGKGYLTINGKKGTYEDGLFSYADGTGFVRQIGDVQIEKDSAGNIVLKENGKVTLKLSADDGGRFITTKDSADYVHNLPSMLALAENNRINREDLKRVGDALVSESTKVYVDNGNIIVESGTAGTDGYKKLIHYPDGTVGSVLKDGEEIKWGKESLVIGTVTYAKVEDDKNPNLELYDLGGVYYSPGNGDMYTKDKNGKYVKCDSAVCENWLKKLADHEEAYRIDIGGPNNAEKGAIHVFDLLESAQNGPGRLFSLFMSDESLARWRNQVDDFMCSTILLGGKDCWISQVCTNYADKVGSSILNVNTEGGHTVPAAHTEGQRQLRQFEDNETAKTEYLYKLSFGVRNPKNSGREMRVNVQVRGDKTYTIYPKDYLIKEGEIWSRAGTKIWPEESSYFYDEICLLFKGGIVNYKGDTVYEQCSPIVDAFPDSATVRVNRNTVQNGAVEPTGETAAVGDNQPETDI